MSHPVSNTPWSHHTSVRHYDLSPQELSRLDADQTWFFMSRLAARQLPPGGSILDVGCAAGSFYGMLTQRGAKPIYTGVDITSEFIIAAKDRYPSASFQIAGAEELPFDDNTFDLVFSKGTLFVASDPMKALAECLRVTGKTLVADFVLNTPGEPDRTIDSHDRGPVYLMGPQGLENAALILAGCKVTTNLLSMAFKTRAGLHPAYQGMNFLKHLVLTVHKEQA